MILKDSVRERSLCPPCQPAGRMTPPCSDSRKLLPHFRIESLRSKVMVKVFCQKSDAPLALLPAAPEPQEAGHQCVNERGALVILKDSVRERSLCPPCQPAGAHDPALLGF